MAARKQTAHFDKSKFVLFSVFGRFCWKFFFPYGSNYGLSLTTKLHVIELLFVNFFVLLWLFFLFSVGELWLERPLETAMLLSLVGVAGVVSSQWHCQLADNKHKLDTYLTGE